MFCPLSCKSYKVIFSQLKFCDCVWLQDREWKHVKVCAHVCGYMYVCVYMNVCVCVGLRACMREIVAGGPQHDCWGWSNHMFSCDFHQHIPGRSHTLSAELCTAPPKDVTCSLQTHGCLTSSYHNTAACRIMGGLNLKPRGAKQTLTSVAPSHWPYRKQSMIYYTVLQKASRSYHARLITG